MCLQNWKHSNDVDAWQGGRLSDLGSGSPRRTTFKGSFLKSLDIKQTLCQVTGCQEFPKGNFLSWENTNWFLNSSRGTVNIQPNRIISCYNWQFYNSSLKFFFTHTGSQGGSWPRNRNLSQILCQLPCGALQTQSELRGHTYIALYILVTLKGKLGEKNL